MKMLSERRSLSLLVFCGMVCFICVGAELTPLGTLEKSLDDSNPDVCIGAMRVFAMRRDFRSEKARKSIGALLANKEPRVREEAARALGWMGSRESLAPLVNALSDTDPDVRITSAWALAKLSPEDLGMSLDSFRPSLFKLLEDAEEDVRLAAIWAINRLRDSLYPEISELNDRSNPELLKIKRRRQEFQDAFCNLLCGKKADGREAAAFALGILRSVPLEAEIAQRVGDAEPKVQLASVWALVHRGLNTDLGNGEPSWDRHAAVRRFIQEWWRSIREQPSEGGLDLENRSSH